MTISELKVTCHIRRLLPSVLKYLILIDIDFFFAKYSKIIFINKIVCFENVSALK